MSQRGLTRGADGLGRLQRVLDLGQVDVRVAVVDEGVEELSASQTPSLFSVPREVVGFLRWTKSNDWCG